MTPQGRTRFKVWLVLVGVFLLGSLTGGALAGIYHLRHSFDRPERHGPHDEEAFLAAMRRELSLSDEQTTAVRAAINETQNAFRSLRDETRPRFDAIRQRERERIRALLSPQQQQQFDAMVARHEAMRAERDRKPH